MTTGLATRPGGAPRTAQRRRTVSARRGALHRKEARGAWTLLAPYLVLLMIAGIIPIIYAIVVSLQKTPTNLEPNLTGFSGGQAFVTAFTDYRFLGTFANVFSVLIIWLPLMLVGIVGLALLVHASPGRFGNTMRFIYYIPGSLAGVANLMLWVYLLNPSQSPIGGLWHALGFETIKAVVATPGTLPPILTAMLFFQGVGTWILIVNGGLNGIPDEIFEAASIDGANAWYLAWHVKLPLIRPWIGYAALMNLAYGFQLFLEPYLLDQVAGGALPDQYTPTQLGFWFAFSNSNFPAAAAMSLVVLVITLGIGLFIVFRSGLFGEEEK
ncbi:sugar ABC transporter permease [Glaciihabitans sp. UYNi722]|uniref:carbohydrate ABC transporter permease n=1 Tax=Glaciihabitans sp. UYNi722 TaxID=3156344 RepID=UPI00339613FB